MLLNIFNYDEESSEGEILVKTRSGDFLCYEHPFSGNINEIKPDEFYAFLSDNAVISDKPYCEITKNPKSYFAYFIRGIKTGENTVTVDDVNFILDTFLPKDIADGQYVEFECIRVDAISNKNKEGITMKNRIYMLTSESNRQMNSFIVTTEEGGLIVIDGGYDFDAPKLLSKLREISGQAVPHIDAWFFSHAHDDHISAFNKIVEDDRGEVEFDRVYYNFPSLQFFEKYESNEAHALKKFYENLPKFADKICIVYQSDEYEVKGAKFEYLYTADPIYKFNCINNSTSVFRMTLGGKTVLFLGDLGIDAGKKLLSMQGDNLKSDMVQMAHHGQDGVDFDVYQAIAPTECIWCTPDWLWNNDAGLGYNTHVFKTIEVRGWMEQLGVKKNYVAKDGDQIIEL